MLDIMEQSSFDEPDFNLKVWALKARISRENTNSRRFSASNLKSFREEDRSFRSNITISSTASSPGYTTREEIDPATYSFTTALKALQAKTVYTWEYLSPDGYTLNSKWNDAEKYICNPLSGEVPLECLSAKTLSGRSFRSVTSRITMSAPLVYPSNLQYHFNARSPIKKHENNAQITIQDLSSCNKGMKTSTTRDMGTQSTPVGLSSGSPSPAPTLEIQERSKKHIQEQGADSPLYSSNGKSDKEIEEVKESSEERYTERNEAREEERTPVNENLMLCRCLSLKGLWMRRRQREKNRT